MEISLELKLLLAAVLFILTLPLVAILLLSQLGINIISDQLAVKDPISQFVEIKDPLTGKVVKEIKATIVWPTEGVITLEFGQRSPWEILHSGIDIAGKLDEPVVPIYEGVVVYSGKTIKGYGRHVIIDHGDNVKSIYAHLNKVFVYSGQRVTSSDVIGGQGKSGWTTGVHLHLQINVYGLPVNPRVFLGLDN